MRDYWRFYVSLQSTSFPLASLRAATGSDSRSRIARHGLRAPALGSQHRRIEKARLKSAVGLQLEGISFQTATDTTCCCA